MNIRDFIITVIVSFLAGVGLGLTIKESWYFLVKMLEKIIRNPRALRIVDFSHFFGDGNEEVK